MRTPESSADIAYDYILESISSRKLKGGERLNESTIATALDMSRTPVREAIRRLQQDGLVEVRKNQGSFLRKYTYSEMADGYEITAMLTQMAVRHLAEKYETLDQAGLADIRTTIERMDTYQKEGKKQEWVALDMYFHNCLIELTGIWQLVHTYQNLMVWVNQVLWLISPVFIDLERSTGDHREIMRLIAEKDPEAAGRYAFEHQLRTVKLMRTLGEINDEVK